MCKEKGSILFSDSCVSKAQCEFQGNIMKDFAENTVFEQHGVQDGGNQRRSVARG